MTSNANSSRDVVIVGGGLAGLSAAAALCGSGASITLLDRRPSFGGRVYSYKHPALDAVVDSQHVVLGCCTNLVDLIARAGAADSIRWYETLNFLEPSTTTRPCRRTALTPGSLPAPMHQTLSFLGAEMLSVTDKAAIARGLLGFIGGYPASDSESFATWLRRTGQTDRAIRHFWEPVVLGALNDSFERCSTKYAGKIFHEAFLSSPEGGRLGIPKLPLTEWLAPLSELVQQRGVELRVRTGMTGLERIVAGPGTARWRVTTETERFETANVVLAMDLKQTRAVLATLDGAQESEIDPFVAAPITTVQLWYDESAEALGIGLDHAVLLDTRIQWIFVKSRIRRWEADRGAYLELVISASWEELKQGREAILASALEELPLFFPKVRGIRPSKSAVLKEARATFSVTPGLDAHRPAQTTRWPGLYLAGDWTRTEWPSTMESAVRSGRLAAGALLDGGASQRFLSPELPAAGLMAGLRRLLG